MLALLLLMQDPGAVVQGKGSPTAAIPRVEATVVIDGKLDEPVWSQATRLTGFWQYQPVDGRPAEEQTEVLVWYEPEAIYFGIIAHDRIPPRSAPPLPIATTSTTTITWCSTSTPSTTGDGPSSSG
jgi:hypothetical protein